VVHQVIGDIDSSLVRLSALPAATNRWDKAMLADGRKALIFWPFPRTCRLGVTPGVTH
jgi:hypothetical protein